MASDTREDIGTRPCWFVGGLSEDGKEDQTPRFLKEGIWENYYEDKYLDLVRSIRVGDRIAIKTAFTRKNNIPFDNKGLLVSVMAIKAIGTITGNPGNGRTLKVDWKPVTPPRDWYFYFHPKLVWKVLPGSWQTRALIAFTFEGKPQDIDRFRNAPYWRERFGDGAVDTRRFNWTRFYEEMADKLLGFRHRRDELIAGIHAIASREKGFSQLQDRFADGTSGPLKDICPFTVMGLFNRGITEANRKTIAGDLANLLGVSEPVPTSFEGIPLLMNQRSMFFGFENRRQPGDIDALWEIFSQAIAFTDSDGAEARPAFVAAYNAVTHQFVIGWNLTMGLYWIRPWYFATLDDQSRRYITTKLNIQIGMNGPKGRCTADAYLTLLNDLSIRFQEPDYPVHSFPDLSLAAYQPAGSGITAPDPDDDSAEAPPIISIPTPKPYVIDDILADGCFIPRDKLQLILERLRARQNLILQGPPGTGKTWLAKRLAFGLMGECDDAKICAVQFHPNLSYEDFVRGWRPAGDGKLDLVEGPFMDMIRMAGKDPSSNYVVVIEEINRGNPAQIFGEMLTLLEADKRTPDAALALSCRRSKDERVSIPANLYIIGTMNIADRSLALIDFALRRRFAFIDLEPVLGKPWHDWVQSKFGIAPDILDEIARRITNLNTVISTDTNLGPQFRVGHSYVTPRNGEEIQDAREWFRQIVTTEIGPLLDEYWFDASETARTETMRLVEGF